MRACWLLALGAAMVGCVSDDSATDGGAKQGELGGICFSNGTCNAGLVCVVPNKCVLPDSGAVDAPDDMAVPEAGGNDSGPDVAPFDAGSCPTTALISWWKGENNANDERGQTVLSAHSITYVAGQVGQAFHVSNPGYLDGTAMLAAGASTLTIEAWIQPLSVVGTEVIFSQRSNGGNGIELALVAGNLTFYGGAAVATGATTFAIGTTYHVAVTAGGSAIQLYVNGQVDSTTASTFAVAADAPIRVGAGHDLGSVPNNFFNGFIDELAIYQSALAPSIIQSIASGSPPPKCQ